MSRDPLTLLNILAVSFCAHRMTISKTWLWCVSDVSLSSVLSMMASFSRGRSSNSAIRSFWRVSAHARMCVSLASAASWRHLVAPEKWVRCLSLSLSFFLYFLLYHFYLISRSVSFSLSLSLSLSQLLLLLYSSFLISHPRSPIHGGTMWGKQSEVPERGARQPVHESQLSLDNGWRGMQYQSVRWLLQQVYKNV